MILKENSKKRWDFVFKYASKIKRCGECTEDGCGCKQPRKIYKQDLAEIFAEWENSDGITEKFGRIKFRSHLRKNQMELQKNSNV